MDKGLHCISKLKINFDKIFFNRVKKKHSRNFNNIQLYNKRFFI